MTRCYDPAEEAHNKLWYPDKSEETTIKDADATDLEEAGWSCDKCELKDRHSRKQECGFPECLEQFDKQGFKLNKISEDKEKKEIDSRIDRGNIEDALVATAHKELDMGEYKEAAKTCHILGMNEDFLRGYKKKCQEIKDEEKTSTE